MALGGIRRWCGMSAPDTYYDDQSCEGQRCDPGPRRVDKVVFVRTACTGSSTLVGILHRFCDNYGKRCQVPKERYSDRYDEYAMHKTVLHRAGKLDVWTTHAAFYEEEFKLLIPGAFKFSTFREPMSRVLSSFRHCDDAECPRDALTALQGNKDYLPRKIGPRGLSRCGSHGHDLMSWFVRPDQ
eukprot:3129518-Amphidinium_carterae.1